MWEIFIIINNINRRSIVLKTYKYNNSILLAWKKGGLRLKMEIIYGDKNEREKLILSGK